MVGCQRRTNVYVQYNGKTKKNYTGSRAEFQIIKFKKLFEKENITIHYASSENKTGNSDIERFHATLKEHLRIIKAKPSEEQDDTDPIVTALYYYNQCTHSTIENRPQDVHFGEVNITQILKNNKNAMLKRANRNRKEEEVDWNYRRKRRIRKLDFPNKKLDNI